MIYKWQHRGISKGPWYCVLCNYIVSSQPTLMSTGRYISRCLKEQCWQLRFQIPQTIWLDILKMGLYLVLIELYAYAYRRQSFMGGYPRHWNTKRIHGGYKYISNYTVITIKPRIISHSKSLDTSVSIREVLNYPPSSGIIVYYEYITWHINMLNVIVALFIMLLWPPACPTINVYI